MYPVVMQSELFEPDFFLNNRRRLREERRDDKLIVVTANGVLQRSNDTTYPFRQDSSFWYLTGINEPDCILVMDGADEYIIVPELSSFQVIFDGAIDVTALQKSSGINETVDAKTGWARLRSALRSELSVATCFASAGYVSGSGYYANPARQRLLRRLRASVRGIRVNDIRNTLMQMRMIKQPAELEAIQQAVDITTKTFNQLYQSGIDTYTHEYELEAALTSGFGSRGAAHAYAPIVASGEQACTLHYVANNQPLAADSYVLIDAGAEVANYAADVTRTYAGGAPSSKQRSLWAAVREAHAYGLSLMRPGRTLQENEVDMTHFLGKQLRQLGYINSETDTSAVRQYYSHGLSHFVGLDVHDVGDYERPLEPGMVLTVEPGLYVAKEQVGVRIEDTVAITKDGFRNLSKDCIYGDEK